MTVFCEDQCFYNKKGVCQLESISIEDGECQDYDEYPGDRKEYKSEYWKAIKTETGGTFRKKCLGLKYEAIGRVFYTDDDIRYGVDDAWFTDGETGYALPGKVFGNATMIARFESMVKNLPNVMVYPTGGENEQKADT